MNIVGIIKDLWLCYCIGKKEIVYYVDLYFLSIYELNNFFINISVKVKKLRM